MLAWVHNLLITPLSLIFLSVQAVESVAFLIKSVWPSSEVWPTTHGWTDLTFFWEKARWCGNSCFLPPPPPPLLLFFSPVLKSSTFPLSPPPGCTGFLTCNFKIYTHTHTLKEQLQEWPQPDRLWSPPFSSLEEQDVLSLCSCLHHKMLREKKKKKQSQQHFQVKGHGKKVHCRGRSYALFNNLLKTYRQKNIWTMLEEGPGVNTAERTGAGMHIKATLSFNLNCPHSKHNTQDFWRSEVMSADIFGWYFFLLF